MRSKQTIPQRAPLLCAVLLLLQVTLPSLCRGNTVTISAGEFQRIVYSAHLLTQLVEKPELDASLQVLLELQRRNPGADSGLLADVLREATARYRTNAPSYIRTGGSRDEILAAFLDVLRQIPARTNFAPASLALLNNFMLQPEDYAKASAAELIHSGNQRLLRLEGDLARRQALVDTCAGRGQDQTAFRSAMDALLVPETLVSLSHTPTEIIGHTNSPLHGNLTMQMLLALSASSGNGSVTVSSNQLINLFTNETQAIRDMIQTNLTVQVEINRRQPDLLAYLGNQPAIDADAQLIADVKRGQPRKLAAATAAVLVQSKLMAAQAPLIKLPGQMNGVVEALHKFTDGMAAFNEPDATGWARAAARGNMLAGGLQVVGLFTGGETAEDAVAREIGNIKILLRDLSENMNYRFDRVDQSLTQIYDTLNQALDQIVISAEGIAELQGNVNEIRSDLVDVQTDLHRLERHLLAYVNQLYDRGLSLAFNTYLGYESTHLGQLLPKVLYDNEAEPLFFTHAVNNSVDELSSPYLNRTAGLYWELTESGGGITNRLDQNLSYIKHYLSTNLSQPTAGPLPVPNPRDWFVGAYAYLQLNLENPMYFRRVNVSNRLDHVVTTGNDVADFHRSLTFSGTSINRPLYTALQDHYFRKLTNFSGQVRTIEQQYASDTGFAIDTWRQWSASAPRLGVTATELVATPAALLPPIPRNATHLAAGANHSLVLQADGKLAAWGGNDYGQSAVPRNATNVVAVAGGRWHNVALRADGTVIAWGAGTNNTGVEPSYGQAIVPANATNVQAVAAGFAHSLALGANDTVLGWGWNAFGQATPPATATNVTAIAAGSEHSLALRADGTVVGWGNNGQGQATGIPSGPPGPVSIAGHSLTNVVAIAAGASHSIALRDDGTIVCWGDNTFNQINTPAGATNVVAIAAGYNHSLALKANGTVLAWGLNNFGQTFVLPGWDEVVAIAAGLRHNLALRADGTVFAWGANDYRQCLVPPALSWQRSLSANWNHFLALRHDGTVADYGVESDYGRPIVPAFFTNLVAVAAGGGHSLGLQPDGKVVAWGANSYGQATVPTRASNVVAIAAGDSHSLALRSDSTVVAWGANSAGQTNIPPGLNNVVAIAAGPYYNLALRADGTVVGWGDNAYGQATPPGSATNVVAIAAGGHSLALRADGTILGWGNNRDGQITLPLTVSNFVAIAAGANHTLALQANGAISAWGNYNYGQLEVPTGLQKAGAIAASADYSIALVPDGRVVGWGNRFLGHAPMPASARVMAMAAGSSHNLALPGVLPGKVHGWGDNSANQATGDFYRLGFGNPRNNLVYLGVPPQLLGNVMAVAAGGSHSVALLSNRTVVAWGDNFQNKTNVPVTATNVVAIAAGANHTLALRADGTVVGWGGDNLFNQANGSRAGTNVLAVAAGATHSLALKANGTVVAWGTGSQTNVPAGLANVVAIAAGYSHSMALRANGTIVCWGNNAYDQTNTPASATNVVAIAAGSFHSLALRSDGTAIGWGDNYHGQTIIPPNATNLIAIAGGRDHSLFLKATGTGLVGIADPFVVRARIPERLGELLQGANRRVLTNLDLALHDRGLELSGSKALLQSVLELGMPYTVERDDVLHGFLYGSESLVDLAASRTFLEAENTKLSARPDASPQALGEVAALRYVRFSERLEDRLNDLAAAREPQLPRLLGQTLRLLNLLRDAWNPVPPPALEIGQGSNSVGLLLYGEPYVGYTLQYRDDLNSPGWTTTAFTNLHNEVLIVPMMNSPQRFYRALLPLP